MKAIQNALAMAKPKHVVACVATIVSTVSSKLSIDTAGNKIDDTGTEEKESIKRP